MLAITYALLWWLAPMLGAPMLAPRTAHERQPITSSHDLTQVERTALVQADLSGLILPTMRPHGERRQPAPSAEYHWARPEPTVFHPPPLRI